MKRVDETTGASTVCVQSLETRSVSRRASQSRPAIPVLDAIVHVARVTVGA